MRKRLSPRRVFAFAAGLAALLAAALLVLLAGRRELAEALLSHQLAARGLPLSAVEVVELGWRQARVRNLAIAGGRIQIPELVAAYGPADLRRGRLRSLHLEAPRIRLDPDAARLPDLRPLGTIHIRGGTLAGADPERSGVASIDGRVAADSDNRIALELAVGWQGSAGRIGGSLRAEVDPTGHISGTLAVTDGELAVPGVRASQIEGPVSFGWRSGLPERVQVNLSAAAVSIGAHPLGPANLTVSLNEGALDLDFASVERSRASRVTVHARARGLPALADYDLVVDAELGPDARPPAELLPLPLEGGRVCLRLAARGRLPSTLLGGASVTGLRRALEATVLELDVDATDLDLPGAVEDLSASLALAANLDGSVLAVELAPTSIITARRLDPGWLGGIGLGPAASAHLRAGARIELGAKFGVVLDAGAGVEGASLDTLALALRIPPDGSAFRLDLAGRSAAGPGGGGAVGEVRGRLASLAGAGLELEGVEFELPLAASLAGSRLRVDLRTAARIGVDRLVIPGTGQRLAALELALLSGHFEQSGNERVRARRRLGVEATMAAATIAWPGSERPARLAGLALGMEIEGETGQQPRGQLELRAGELRVPSPPLAIEGLELRLSGSRAGAEGTFAIGRLSDLSEPARVAALRLAGNLSSDGDRIAARGTLQLSAPVPPFRFDAGHQLGTGVGSLRLETGELAFAPDFLQPRDLLPPLATLGKVRGRAGARIRSAWDHRETVTGVHIQLDGLSFRADDLAVSGLSLDLDLDAFGPLQSRPDACLRVERLASQASPPVEDLEARFSLRPGRTPRIALDAARFRLLGGGITVAPTELVPAEGALDLELAIDQIDLSLLLAWFGIDGISGSGRFSGRVPLAFSDQDLVVSGGTLSAQLPGVLRIHSPRVHDLLSGRGEPVDLLVRALEDFHYRSFELALSQSPDSETRVGMQLKGSNPAVLEGHPFHINIDARGNTRSILDALRESYRLRQRIWPMLRK